ncbi:MAG: YitT family protein [Thermodesulfobacteriota bacterium]
MSPTWGNKFGSVKRVAINLGLIVIGGSVYMIGVNSLLVPQHFLNGGVLGISLLIHYLFPFLGVGLLYALFNLPLFLLGWFHVSRRFILYTLFGIAFFSLATDLIKVPPFPVVEPILAAILAGIICGFGAGIVFRSSGSMGGIDILSVYLYKKMSLRFGLTSFMVNVIVLSLASAIFSLEMGLYTLIFVYTQSRLTDAVITGFNRRQSVLIISDKHHEISQAILTDLHRGVTFLEGIGAYTGRRKEVILSIITMTELARMKELVLSLDPQAFMVINETLEVLGVGHGHKRDY